MAISAVFDLEASPEILEITQQASLWLIYHQNDGSVFVSLTQDTVMGLQALATYQLWTASIVSITSESIDI